MHKIESTDHLAAYKLKSLFWIFPQHFHILAIVEHDTNI